MTERFFGTYHLNEEEIAEKAQLLAKTVRNLEAKELEKKSAASQFASEINGLKEEIYGLKNQVLDGEETGYFDCETAVNGKTQVKHFFFNSQEIGTRPLSEDEKQLHMKDQL